MPKVTPIRKLTEVQVTFTVEEFKLLRRLADKLAGGYGHGPLKIQEAASLMFTPEEATAVRNLMNSFSYPGFLLD